MREWGQRAEHPGVAEQDIQSPETPKQRFAQPIESVVIPEIAGHKRGRLDRARTKRTDFVIELLERPRGSCERDDVYARGGQCERGGATNSAGGAGD